MTEQSGADEGWSALMDDEVDDAELGKLLEGSSDPQVRQRFQRYQIARAMMRGERFEGHEFTDLSGRIRDALGEQGAEAQPATSAEVIEFKPRDKQAEKQKVFGEFWKSMGSIAIAASVAGVVVLGARYLDAPAGLEPAAVVAETSVEEGLQAQDSEIIRAATDLEAEALPSGDSRQTRFILRASDPRISDYQRRHLQFTAEAGGGGMMPFARVVSLESDQQ